MQLRLIFIFKIIISECILYYLNIIYILLHMFFNSRFLLFVYKLRLF